MGGGRQVIIEPPSRQYYGKNVYADDGLCPTLCSGSVVKNGLNIRESKS